MAEVVHVIDSLSVGGAQRLLTILADSGRKLRIIDLAGRPSGISRQLEEAGAVVVPVGATRAIHPLHWWRCLRALRAERAEVLHLHLTNAVLFGATLGWILRRKVVVTLHNTKTVAQGKALSRLKAKVETFLLRHVADHVIHVGERVRMANEGRLGPVPQTVLPNVILNTPAGADFDRAALRRALGAGEGDFVFVSTGRLNPQKDHDTLLRAVALLPDMARVRVWLAGEGPLRAQIEEQIAAAGLGGRVSLLGTGRPVAHLLAAAEGFVLSSAWEGLPLGLLEAMAAGVPVVATSVGDVPTLLQGGAGVMVPPKDAVALAGAMRDLATDPARSRDMVQRARSAVAPFLDVEGWMSRTDAVYRSVLSGRGR